MATKLYVGNLSFQTSEQDLQKSFEPFGSVRSSQVVTDRFTNQSRGFAFVEMSTNEEAQAAITGLNGQVVNGRALVVNESKPREGASSSSSRGSRDGYRDRY
jgi:RNA recognition motif-containing protein